MTLKVLELFGGIGAPRAALERLDVDFEIVDYVEIDKFAVQSYNAMYGESYEPQDITQWDKDIEVDIIFHGSPCQDFSVAGNNAGGKEGSKTRSSLMWDTVRIVDKLKPKVVIWENVKNVLGKKHKPTFYKYINTMSDMGYSSYTQVLNAKHYGIPQNRERVFVISILGTHTMYEFPQARELELRLKDMLENEVDEKYYLSEKATSYIVGNAARKDLKDVIQRDRMKFNPYVAYTLGTKVDRRVGDSTYIIDGHDELSTSDYLKIKNATKKGYLEAYEGDGVDTLYPNSNTRRGRVQSGLSQTITTDNSKGVVVSDSDKSIEKIKNNLTSIDDVSRTITANPQRATIDSATLVIEKNDDNSFKDQDYINGVRGLSEVVGDVGLRIRKLTPKECWRLMDFDDHLFEKAQEVNSNTQLYKQAGNSIVVNVLVEILGQLIKILPTT